MSRVTLDRKGYLVVDGQRGAAPTAGMQAARARSIAPRPNARSDDFSYEVAGAWSALSPFKAETGIAVERFRLLYERGLDPVLLYYGIATLAAQARDERHAKAPYHAVLITEPVMRLFCARIAEILRDAEKADDAGRRPARGLRNLGLAIATEMGKLRARSEGINE